MEKYIKIYVLKLFRSSMGNGLSIYVVTLEWKLGLRHGSTVSDVKVPLLIMEVTVLKFGRNTNLLEYEVSKNIIAA